ncbi:MAG: 50S ribosomal protein L29 [Chloroflexi bacterium]|nr:50S ribosomal protein L29 [Chloroflexota bacterium]MYA50196.1 50S ribosomal protein L29 [Chloroflexota bacterium]MYB85019.1 50S ribosomal protein L29 [Chloroflexota bacterium]MYF65180.1 50S ribosomal protein L29 [Chloroflexota bacterium]MYK33621.1 50S ribosomal protein L29 [Chloroflexota bacterium]
MRAKIETVRALSDERLKEEEFSTRLELMNLRFKVATRQLSDPSELRDAKRRLAHILTVARERELMEGAL